jgi:HAD superfamily hydrolase (TIGR01484 family)
MKELVVFDIDGTAVEARPEAIPSDRLIRAARNFLSIEGNHLSCATGRTYAWAKGVIAALDLVDPCIVAAGTQIVDPKTGQELWSKRLTVEAVVASLGVFAAYGLDPKILTELDTPDTARTASELTHVPRLLLDVQDIDPSIVDAVISEIKETAEVEIAKVHSPNVGFINLHITDKQATKEHAVEQLRNMTGVDLANTYGIGDGYNDIHLFRAVGHKIAIGNAVQELKDAADRVVAPLKQDGLAQLLEELTT